MLYTNTWEWCVYNIHPHLDVPVVQSLCELFKLLTDFEGDGVVSEGAESFDDILISLLLNHLSQLQPQGNLSQINTDTWNSEEMF